MYRPWAMWGYVILSPSTHMQFPMLALLFTLSVCLLQTDLVHLWLKGSQWESKFPRGKQEWSWLIDVSVVPGFVYFVHFLATLFSLMCDCVCVCVWLCMFVRACARVCVGTGMLVTYCILTWVQYACVFLHVDGGTWSCNINKMKCFCVFWFRSWKGFLYVFEPSWKTCFFVFMYSKYHWNKRDNRRKSVWPYSFG